MFIPLKIFGIIPKTNILWVHMRKSITESHCLLVRLIGGKLYLKKVIEIGLDDSQMMTFNMNNSFQYLSKRI